MVWYSHLFHSGSQAKLAALSSMVADGKGAHEIIHSLLKLPPGNDIFLSAFHWPEQISWPHLIQGESRIAFLTHAQR